jgi:uncharacterized SAM-binding protein YcdF (DUF218 family)
MLAGVYPLLAVTDRVDSDLLVMEGWAHEFAIRAGAEECSSRSYQFVFITGGPVAGNGGYTGDQDTAASVGAGRLRKAGVPTEAVKMVPSHLIGRDRTYNSAISFRDWFREHRVVVGSLNVVTEAAHARRTRLLFQEAFGANVSVGIFAVPNPDYDAKHWWRYSQGAREVIGESIAYIYAKVFFNPSKAGLH